MPDVQTTRPWPRRSTALLLVAAASATAAAHAADTTQAAQVAQIKQVAPGAQVASRGDLPRGQALYEARCGGCHSVAADRIGPRHAGLFGRRAGSVAGFDYSPALQRAGLVWDARTLDRWLTDPEALLPGQRMGYRLTDAAERAEVIAYLATLVAPGAAAQAGASAPR